MSVIPISINYHLYKPCNDHCRFCFATFRDIRGCLDREAAKDLISRLRHAGGAKLNFAGGEPTLYPGLGDLIQHAKELGFVTSIVTNGARLDALIEQYGAYLDWVGLSVDSGQEEVQAALGRGRGGHVQAVLDHARKAQAAGIRVKLNTVVTALTWQEDMSWLLQAVRPLRWKIFQVLPVAGQNDGSVEDLLITRDQFQAFLARHKHLEEQGTILVPEDNDAMIHSYAMIDPLGRFYGYRDGRYIYSEPIRTVGVMAALAQVDFSLAKLTERGGRYDW